MAAFNDKDTPPVRYQPPKTTLVQEEVKWCDRRRWFFGLPWSFTKYILYPDRLVIQSGFLTRRTEEIRLYRVLDVSLKQSLGQRLFQTGSVKLQTADVTSPVIFLHDVLHSEAVYRLLSEEAEKQRIFNRIGVMEFIDPLQP